MSARVVTADVTITYGDGTGTLVRYGVAGPSNAVFLRRGTLLDVQPGSALEAAIGTSRLRAPTAAELASASMAPGGFGVSN